MRLASVEVIPYALPFRESYVTARGRLDRREMVLLRLRSAEGVVGLGEAVPLSLRGGAALERVVGELEAAAESGAIDRFARRLEMDPETEAPGICLEWESVPDWDAALSLPARCAVMTALLDASEREEAIPRNGFSVGRHDHGPITCNASLIAAPPATVAEEAGRWAERGFRTFKLKVGAGDDVAQVRAVREALGPEAKIRLDANGCWSLDQARRLLVELEEYDIELVEQPVATVEEATRLAKATEIPLAGDESIVSKADARQAVETGAFQASGIKVSKVGGIGPGMEIASVIPSYVASALDGPVGIAAGARLAQRLHYEGFREEDEHFAHGLATQRLFSSTIAAVECELRGDQLRLPPGPGLGVEIDEDALEAHRI